jgi:hypothetical protein
VHDRWTLRKRKNRLPHAVSRLPVVSTLAGGSQNQIRQSLPAFKLFGSDGATAGGINVRSSRSPVFELCRLLMAANANPKAALECFRGGVLALTVKTIRAGAGLRVRETTSDGPRVVAWNPYVDRRVKPPARRIGGGVLHSHLLPTNGRQV